MRAAILGTALALLACAATQTTPGPDATKELAALDGTWEFRGATYAGWKLPRQDVVFLLGTTPDDTRVADLAWHVKDGKVSPNRAFRPLAPRRACRTNRAAPPVTAAHSQHNRPASFQPVSSTFLTGAARTAWATS